MSPYSLSFSKLIAGLCICLCFPGLARSQYFPRASEVSEFEYAPTLTLNLDRGISENEEAIVERFIETETRQRAALNQHMFKRDVVLQTIEIGRASCRERGERVAGEVAVQQDTK